MKCELTLVGAANAGMRNVLATLTLGRQTYVTHGYDGSIVSLKKLNTTSYRMAGSAPEPGTGERRCIRWVGTKPVTASDETGTG